MTKFSAVVITLNEEEHIAQCIEALKAVSDDIVVVDAYSNDKTVEIAQSSGARVYKKEWQGYGISKNFGASKCKNDWIISIDADEVISKELAHSINKLDTDDKTAYKINILSNFLGAWIRHSGWYPEWKVRIYNKNVFSWDDKEVHEKLISKEKEYTIKKLKGVLYHYSYSSVEEVEEKTERYAKLLAKEMIRKNKKPSIMKVMFGPAFKFFRIYILELGILDGKSGYLIGKMNSEVVRRKIKYYGLLEKGQEI